MFGDSALPLEVFRGLLIVVVFEEFLVVFLSLSLVLLLSKSVNPLTGQASLMISRKH